MATKFINSHLNLAELQRRRDLTSLGEAQIFLRVKLAFEFQQLLTGECRPPPPWLSWFRTVSLRSLESVLVIIAGFVFIVRAVRIRAANFCWNQALSEWKESKKKFFSHPTATEKQFCAVAINRGIYRQPRLTFYGFSFSCLGLLMMLRTRVSRNPSECLRKQFALLIEGIKKCNLEGVAITAGYRDELFFHTQNCFGIIFR